MGNQKKYGNFDDESTTQQPYSGTSVATTDMSDTKMIRNSQKWTLKYGVVLLVGSLLLSLFGFANALYDIIIMAQFNKTSQQVYHDPRPAHIEGKQQQDKTFTFKMDTLTFIFLQGTSFLLNSMTLVQGILGLISVFKSLKVLREVKKSGNNPRELYIMQNRTKRFEDLIKALIIFQVIISFCYSIVYAFVIKRSLGKFESENSGNLGIQEERMISDIQSLVYWRCFAIVFIYLFGCSFCVCLNVKFRKHQKDYEDVVLSLSRNNPGSHTMSLGDDSAKTFPLELID